MPVGELDRSAHLFRLALLLTPLFAVQCTAQAERLPIKTYTTADGLARDQANRIVRDSKGFLWFCTIEGLSRFDGYRFTNYGTDQGLPHRQVNDFLETRSGVYWVATNGGLCRFNPHASPPSGRSGGLGPQPRFIVYRLGDDASSQVVYTLCEDRAGTVWCGTYGGLYRLDQINGQWTSSFSDLHQPTDNGYSSVISIIEDRRGALWVSTGRGLYRRRLDGILERYATEEALPIRNFTAAGLLEDREGRS